VSEKERNIEYRGRIKIYTDVKKITSNNVIDVLSRAMIKHEQNRTQIRYLINFEKGDQPLMREKKVRKDIDIKSISNLAHQITEFWLGYFWGNHMAFVQKSDKHPKGSNPTDNDSAITLLNEMYDAEDMESKDQLLAYYLEVCGTCCQLIDIKRKPDDEDAVFDLVTLNPLYSFVVYSSDAYERPMMGVSYSEDEDGSRIFTCVADDAIYEIRDMVEIVNGAKKKDGMKLNELEIPVNPFGRVNIVEFERATDRTGVFERQLDELNALNILESDLCNDVAQTTQANWWGNDIELDKDDDGKVKGPQGGQWILTKTNGQGKQPNIKGLVLDYNYDGVLANIQAKHDGILERTFTPKQTEQSGGSTTGATSLSSGWTATEAVACKQAAIIKRGFKERNRLALIAIKKSPDTDPESPLLKLKNSDIEIRPIRQKSYDMATKINSLATMVQNFVHPRVAMEAIDFFPNLAEAVEDSVPKMLEYQKVLLESKKSGGSQPGENKNDDPRQQQDADKVLKEKINPDVKRIMQDSSDQVGNSPLKDL
jgi:phage portal protein, SPP1 gp6-like